MHIATFCTTKTNKNSIRNRKSHIYLAMPPKQGFRFRGSINVRPAAADINSNSIGSWCQK